MSSSSVVFESGHEELIHDAQFDYYGKRLATCSSDRSVRVFDLHGDRQVLAAQLRGHDGPVWSVAWGHPKFGSVLASAAYDGKIIIWKETNPGQWIKLFEHFKPDCSWNSVQFAPVTFGLQLAAAGSDGSITVFTKRNEQQQGFEIIAFPAHKGGVNGLSYGPDMKTGALLANGNPQANQKFERRLVSGGCDGAVKIWKFEENGNMWVEDNGIWGNESHSHSDWVRDVAWAPSIGLPASTIASCSEDRTVAIWTEDPATGLFRKTKTISFPCKLYRVSWSTMGNILAVSQGDNNVSLWKEGLDGEWRSLSANAAQQIQAQAAAAQQPMNGSMNVNQSFNMGEQKMPDGF